MAMGEPGRSRVASTPFNRIRFFYLPFLRYSELCVVPTPHRRSDPLQHQRGVRAAESKAVRHDGGRPHRVRAADDGKSASFGVERVDVRGSGQETIAHREQAIDGLVHTGRTERMSRERFRG